MAMLHTHVEDECCGPVLDAEIRIGGLDALSRWMCPLCHCDWVPILVGPVKHWEPKPYVAVIR